MEYATLDLKSLASLYTVSTYGEKQREMRSSERCAGMHCFGVMPGHLPGDRLCYCIHRAVALL